MQSSITRPANLGGQMIILPTVQNKATYAGALMFQSIQGQKNLVKHF